MRIRCCIYIVISSSILGSMSLHAYELATHGRLSYESFLASNLTDKNLLSTWGISDGPDPFGEEYYEITNDSIIQHRWDNFEQDENRMPKGAEPLSIPGWLMRGAIREDDYLNSHYIWPLTDCSVNAPNPQYEGLTNRPMNHFFDPWTNQPLETWLGIDLGERAPKWGFGSVEPFNVPQQEETGHENHYTLFDAMEAMYRALTSHSSDGSNLILPDGFGGSRAPASAEEEETARQAYWATTFRSLGDVVHLIQDMAQPQHTRNDPHSGTCGPWVQDNFTGHASVYESYVEARAKGGNFVIPGTGDITTEPLNYGGYPIPELSDNASYFSTRHLDESILSSRGLADYSNRGFFTAGTNLGSNRYAYPSNNPADYSQVNEVTDWSGMTLPNGSTYTLLYGNVNDSLQETSDVAALTTEGLWDQFLVERGYQAQYTLTKRNYDDMADLLIPRAVSYGAGFINYFFRGRVDVTKVEEDIDTATEKLIYHITVKNISASGNNFKNGVLEFFYNDIGGLRQPMTLLNSGNAKLGATGLAPGEEKVLDVEVPDDRDFSSDMVVVFYGEIGNEPGLTGRVFDNGPDVYVLDIEGGYVYQFTSNGILRDVRVAGGNIGITVYNGTIYTAGGDNNDASANDTELYRSYVNSTDAWVEVYDHQGGYLRQMSASPGYYNFGGEVRVAANNTHFATTNNEELYIYTSSGSQTGHVNGISIANQEVAITKDRVYIIDDGTVEIYNLSGGYEGLVPGGPFVWFGSLAVTENHLYISETVYNGKSQPRTNLFHIYDRDVARNEAGDIVSDSYQFRETIDFSAISNQPRFVDVDREGMILQ